jgi:hypothetical protein
VLLYMPEEHFEHLMVALLPVKVPTGQTMQEVALALGW